MVSAMTNQEAFILVANLDRPEAAQASRPRHSLVVFSPAGEVQAVYRYRRPPDEREKQAILALHPGCLQLAMEAGSCQQESTLGRAIRRQLRQAGAPSGPAA